MIAEAIRQARGMHRMVIEETYDGVCRIYEQQSIEDPETFDTVFQEVEAQGGIPCHLSYSSSPAVSGSDTVPALSQVIRLFLAPEVVICPGSRIEVTQQGVTESYSGSGHPAVYSSHQEIELTLFRGYA